MGQNGSVRVGWVGCGRFSFNVLLDCLKGTALDVVAASDIDESRLNTLARRYPIGRPYRDWRSMLDEESLDAVICVANPQVHYEVAREALLVGLPVFVEKMPCASVEQAEELAALQRSTGKHVMVGFNRRHTPAYVKALQIIRGQDFGRTTMYWAKYNAGPYASEKAFLENHLIHHLDLARFFLGEIVGVRTDRFKIDDTRVGFVVCLRAASGAIGAIQSGSLQGLGYPVERVEITGEGSCVIVDNVQSVVYHNAFAVDAAANGSASTNDGNTRAWIPNLGSVTGERRYGFEEELLHFSQCIQSGTVPSPDIRDGLESMRLVETIQRSLS